MILELVILLTSGLLLATLCVVAAKIVSCQLALAKFKKLSRGLPIFPGAKLICNHAYNVFLGERNCQKLMKCHQEMGKTIGWLRGTDFCASTVDLDFIKTFIQDEPSQHLDRIFYHMPLKELEYSISTVPKYEWQVLRRAIAPALAPNKFKTPIVEREIEESIDKLIGLIETRLDSDETGRLFEADDFCARYAVNLIFKCFYKKDNEVNFESARDETVDMIEEAMAMMQTSPFVRISMVFPTLKGLIDRLGDYLTLLGAVRRKMVKFVEDQTRLGLEGRRQLRSLKEEGREKGVRVDSSNFALRSGAVFKRNMADHIVDQYLDGKLSKSQFINNSIFFLAAGYRTAADCLIHTIYLLSIDQQVQDQLRASIEKEGAESEYLDWVLKESLRLLPPAPVGCSRTISRDIELANGHIVPKGTYVSTNAYVIHRLTEYWGEDAEEFRPERWRDTSHHHPMQYIPFGAGLRGCPGKHFAMYEMKMLFTALLTRYKFTGKPRDDAYEFNCPLFLFILPNSLTQIQIARL